MLLQTLGCICVFGFSVFVYFGYICRNGIAGSYSSSILSFVFLETSILFSTMASPIYIPISSIQRFPFLHILANISLWSFWASLLTQLVKNLSAMWETWVRSLGWEDPLEKGMVTHSSILAWRILTVVLICISLMINSVELGTLFWRSFRSHLSHYCL